MAMSARDRARLLRPQSIPLWLGVAPLVMVLAFALRSGTGANLLVLAFAALGLLGFTLSAGYHFFCRASIPKVVIKPMKYWRGAIVAIAVLPLTLLNTMGAGVGQSLILSPTPMLNPMRWASLAAKVLLGATLKNELASLPQVDEFLTQGVFMGGALWGALGFAFVFALAGFGFAALRQEVFDPRQEAFGGSSSWPFLRMMIGYYYGMSLGFWFGAAVIGVGTKFLASGSGATKSVQLLLAAFGAMPNPNLAFTNGVSMAGWLVVFSTLFLGRADFTAPFTDPRPEEREPDMKIKIPPLPKLPEPEFDFNSIAIETETIAQSFQSQLAELAKQLGFSEPVEPAASIVMVEEEDPDHDTPSEPAVANVISARRPDFDVSFDSAMGQLSNVYVQVSAQLGATELPLTEWLTMAEGTILELPRPKDNTISLCINGRAVGRGKAVMLEDHKAIKVLALSADATKHLGR